jgi:hypothetical protein
MIAGWKKVAKREEEAKPVVKSEEKKADSQTSFNYGKNVSRDGLNHRGPLVMLSAKHAIGGDNVYHSKFGFGRVKWSNKKELGVEFHAHTSMKTVRKRDCRIAREC